MASACKIAQNKKRIKLAAKYAKKRAKLKATIKNTELDDDVRYEAQIALQKLPRNSNPVRIRNRCQVTGRPRGYYRKFAMSRIAIRDFGLSGQIPGLTKSSW